MQSLGGLRVRLTFPDRLVRELDLDRLLQGGIFGSLRDPAAFAKVIVDEVAGTVAWSNGIDLAPDRAPWRPLSGDWLVAPRPRGYTL